MTDLVIIKRDGRKVDFDPSKIYHAVDQAMTAIGLRKVSAASNEESINTFADQVTHLVTDKIEHLQVASIGVEQIQDLVEETLIEQNRSDIAKHYIVYRQQRSDAREINSSTNEMIDHILHVTSADDDDKRENGNINTDAVMGSMLKIGSSVTKNYNLAKLLNPKHVKMHRDGVIHMHDLDFMSLCANCLFIPLNKLLRDGFSTGHGFLRSPTTIRSAAALTCIAIQSSQNDMFGGQAIPSFDYYLAPYVAKSFVRHFSDYLEIVTSISDTVRKEYFIRPLDAFIMKHNGIYKYRDEVKAQYDILRAQPCLEEDNNVDTEQQFTDAWKYAERKTIQETHQAMEALTHNLCSMQCFPGYEDLWVYDRLANQWCIFTFEELHRKFTLGRFAVLSVNQSTGAVEMKEILDCVARDNDKRMISIVDASGAGYVSTYDHRYMTSNPDATLGYTPAIDASHTTMPRGFTIPTLNHDTGMEIFSNYDAEVTTFIPYSQELAELLGYFVADGWTTADSLVIGFNANSEVNPVHIAELFHVVFGVETEQHITDGSSSIYPEHNRDLVIHCDLYIARYIEKLCGQNIYSRHVPNFVLTGEENYQNSFTRAFFSNAIDSRTFATNSSSLIYDMRLMSLANNRLLTVNMTNVTADTTEPAVHRYVGSIKDAGVDLRSSDASGIRVFNESIVSKTDAPDAEIVYDISVRDNENFMLANGAIVHNSRAGSQTPFSSINFGLDTSWEGRLISSEVLDAGYAGLGHGETALFPITIFKMKKGVNDKGSPNYDLFQKACKVTALRMLPNFVNVDAPFNLEYYQPDRPETHIATMGCVHGTETSLWKLGDEIYVSDFGRMSRILMNKYPLIQYSEISYYMDLEKVDIGIWDSFNNKFAKVKKFIINKNVTNWRRIRFNNGRSLIATGDHPLPVEGRGRISVDELREGDKIRTTSSYPLLDKISETSRIDYYWLLGMILCDGGFNCNGVVVSVGADETELKDEIVRCSQSMTNTPSIPNVTVKLQERGVKGRYYDVAIRGVPDEVKQIKNEFGSALKIFRHVPNSVFNQTTRAEKVAFLAGMIDADGYVNDGHRNAIVQIGSVNKILAYGQAILAEMLGCHSKIYINHYRSASETENIRYRVEFFASEELMHALRCNKKRNRNSNYSGKSLDAEYCSVQSVEKIILNANSYDVETDTDRFDVGMVRVHNCRTRVLSNVYDKNHVQTDGRGNLFWTTINMPYLALEAKEQAGDIITNFFRRLDEVIDDVIDFSHDRFNIIAHRKAYNFPFLMGQHEYVGSDDLLPESDIREVIKNGTIAIGFIGLAETLLTLVGKHHGESDEAQALGLKIIQHMKDRADRQTKLENINYSVMGSPAEGCTGRLCKAIKKRWGVIPGITDKPYLVNSTHVPPSYKTTLVHKVEIEAPYHALCLGGHIWYGEIDANTAANVEAVEHIVTYIASKGCGYFSLNHPMMRDPICGYVGAPAPDGSCPRCGRKEFEGVAAWKLLQLHSYSPDPEYLVRSDMLTYEDDMPEPNSLEGLSVED